MRTVSIGKLLVIANTLMWTLCYPTARKPVDVEVKYRIQATHLQFNTCLLKIIGNAIIKKSLLLCTCYFIISGCQNSGEHSDENCIGWKSLGYCTHSYVQFMLDHCWGTCGCCSNSGEYSDEACVEWKNYGYCTHTYVEFMLDHCKKTCGGC